MRRFSPLPAPFTEEPQIQDLADHTGEVQEEIENSLTTVHDLDVVNAAPQKPENGMLRYADGVAWDPGHGEGVYFYRNGEWVPTWMTITPTSDYIYILAGTPNNGTINTGNFKLQNYTEDYIGEGSPPEYISMAAGEITIPVDGVWVLTAWVFGYQGNDQKEESLFLKADVDGIKYNLAVFSVATDKTDDRYFMASLTRPFFAGEVVSLFMSATADMGTFNFEATSFELLKLQAT